MWKARAAQVLTAGAVLLSGVVVAAPAALADPLTGTNYDCRADYQSDAVVGVNCRYTGPTGTLPLGYVGEANCYRPGHPTLYRSGSEIAVRSYDHYQGDSWMYCPLGYEADNPSVGWDD